MQDRVFVDKQHPEVFKAWQAASGAAEQAAQAAGIDERLIELIRMRVSQINGCAFCLDLHTRKAVALGESVQRLAVVAAWRHARALFNDTEQAALTLAESLTELPSEAEQAAAFSAVADILDADQVSAVTWVTMAINGSNRMSIVSEHPVRERPIRMPKGS